MCKHVLSLALLLLGGTALAQTLPAPRPLPSQVQSTMPIAPSPPVWRRGSQAPPAPAVDPAELQRRLNRLKAERTALHEERTMTSPPAGDDSVSAEKITQLRLRLSQLLGKLGTRRFPERLHGAAPAAGPSLKKMVEPLPPAPEKGKLEITPEGQGARPVDPMALGRTLFRAHDFAGALAAFRQVPLTGLKPEERRPIEYLMGTCLKHLGKVDEAATLFREVASSKGDEVLADCAQWQLNALRWQQDLTKQIHDLQQRLQSLENQP